MRHFLLGLTAVFLIIALVPQGSGGGPIQDAWDTPAAFAHVPERALEADPTLHGIGPEADVALMREDAEAVVDKDTEFVSTDDLPPDPLGTGTAALHLVFVDAETGAPIETRYVLWRLDVPGNANWTRGDQAQATGDATTSGVHLQGLPEGHYRVHSHAARRSANDAPAFVVSGDATTQQVRVALPRMRHAYVTVFDEHGNTLERAGRIEGSGGFSTRHQRAPEWVADRRLTGNRVHFSLGGGSGISCGCTARRTAVPIDATPQGFDMGLFEEASRYASRSHRRTLRFKTNSEVRARIQTASLSAPPLVGLAVSTAWIRGRVRLPDGRLLADTDYELEATSDAVHPKPGAGAFETAAAILIDVTVKDGDREVGTAVMDLNATDVLLKPGTP